MAKSKKRPSLTGLTSGNSALTRHVVGKGETTHDAPARAAAKAVGAPGLRYMQTRLSESGWKALRLLAIETGRPMQQIVIEALNDMLRKHGRAPDVTGPETDGKEEK